MRYQSEMLQLTKLILYTALILLPKIYPISCQSVDLTKNNQTTDITQLQDAKLLKTKLLVIIKNAEKFISNLDEWAIQKTVNITKTEQLSCENIEQFENEILQIQNRNTQLKNKLKEHVTDINKIAREKIDIEGDLKLLDEKFEQYLSINLRILGEFYDDRYSDIIGEKENLHSDMKRISERIDEIRREMEMNRLLNECADAIRQRDYQTVIFKLKLLENYECDLNAIIAKLYSVLGFNDMLKFATNIRNFDISTMAYQKIYIEIKNATDDQTKILLVQGMREFFDNMDRDSGLDSDHVTNGTNVLKEQWKELINMYVYEFITLNPRELHRELIAEVAKLDGTILSKAFADVFDEMIHLKGKFASIDKDNIREVYTAYFDAIETVFRHSNMWQIPLSSALITLAYQTKRQLSLLKGFPYFFRLPRDGTSLKDAFPSSVNNLVFSDYVCIMNYNNKYLTLSNTVIDGFKNLVSVGRGLETTSWKIEQHNLTTFKIFSKDGALFVDDDYYNFGRLVYTNPNFNNTNSDAMFWEFEYDEFIYIKSKLYSEYLYDPSNKFILSNKLEKTKWIITNCS